MCNPLLFLRMNMTKIGQEGQKLDSFECEKCQKCQKLEGFDCGKWHFWMPKNLINFSKFS
jgi:hypothetical protein